MGGGLNTQKLLFQSRTTNGSKHGNVPNADLMMGLLVTISAQTAVQGWMVNAVSDTEDENGG